MLQRANGSSDISDLMRIGSTNGWGALHSLRRTRSALPSPCFGPLVLGGALKRWPYMLCRGEMRSGVLQIFQACRSTSANVVLVVGAVSILARSTQADL